MKRIIVGLALVVVLISFKGLTDKYVVKYPVSWPKPVYDFKEKPLSKKVIQLGRDLFYDPVLSADNTISCSSCHLSYSSFTHVDHDLSHGIENKIGRRNSPVLVNLAWQKHFMMDGAVNHIEVQGLAPITNPLEMGEDLNRVIDKLEKTGYSFKFKEAFGSEEITGERLLLALAQFQLTFISQDSKYDRVIAGGEVFTEQENKGFLLFNKHCNTCHTAPLFTNGGFENNGLPLDTVLNDLGRFEITQNEEDIRKFKVPTLRNISYSYPYMHDGRFKKLFDVLKHYQRGMESSSTLSNHLKDGLSLSNNEILDLIAFLRTLDDKSFVFNPSYAFPKEK